MIYYFSGTGNSRYCASRLASLSGDSFAFIPDKSAETVDDEVFGLVFPVYSWGVPPVVLDFISALKDGYSPRYVYAVFVCGDETGNAPRMLEKSLSRKMLTADGIMSVIMPNNYVLLPGFDVDSRVVEERKLSEVETRLEWIAECVRKRDNVRDYIAGSFPRLKTGLIYPLFRKWGIIRSLWHHTDACIHCGKCAEVCPAGNIVMEEDGPVFGDRCLSCVACYHHCPVKSIQYGKITKGKGQYYFGMR